MIACLIGLWTASTPTAIAPTISGAMEPQAAFLSDQELAVAFGTRSSLYVSVQRGDGQAFDEPVMLSRAPGLAIGKRRGPRIAWTGRALVVTASYPSPADPKGRDFLAFTSTDRGKTWTNPVRVNDAAGKAPEGLHAMCALADGGVACLWLDLRSGRMELFASVSRDDGRTWSKNVLVYRSPDGDVCECCHPSIAPNPGGGFTAMWRNSLGGSRDMYWSSTQDGVRFTPAMKLGAGTWEIKMCPMDGGGVAVGDGGAGLSVWRRGRTVYSCDFSLNDAAKSDARERELGSGEQPWVASSGSQRLIVWLASRHASLLAIGPGESEPRILAERADDPVAVVAPSGGFAVVWSEPDGPKALRLPAKNSIVERR